jgi:hypothetical protein
MQREEEEDVCDYSHALWASCVDFGTAIDESFLDPITNETMVDPVTWCDGYIYDNSTIDRFKYDAALRQRKSPFASTWLPDIRIPHYELRRHIHSTMPNIALLFEARKKNNAVAVIPQGTFVASALGDMSSADCDHSNNDGDNDATSMCLDENSPSRTAPKLDIDAMKIATTKNLRLWSKLIASYIAEELHRRPKNEVALESLCRRIERIPGDVDYKYKRLESSLSAALDHDASTPPRLRPALENYRTYILPLLCEFEKQLDTMPSRLAMRPSERDLYALSEHLARDLRKSGMQPVLVMQDFKHLLQEWEAENGTVPRGEQARRSLNSTSVAMDGPKLYSLKQQLMEFLVRFDPDAVWKRLLERAKETADKYPGFQMHLYHMRVMQFSAMRLRWSVR